MGTKELGQFGEDLAFDYLRKNGYKVLERNYIKVWDDKTKGEIDIIAKKGDIVCFIEVKTQKENKGFYPEDKVNYKKQKKLVKLSQSWFSERKISLDSKWQIDVIGILLNQEKKKTEIRHFKNVVEAS